MGVNRVYSLSDDLLSDVKVKVVCKITTELVERVVLNEFVGEGMGNGEWGMGKRNKMTIGRLCHSGSFVIIKARN